MDAGQKQRLLFRVFSGAARKTAGSFEAHQCSDDQPDPCNDAERKYEAVEGEPALRADHVQHVDE